jgi:heme oxygenase (biliverdin-IX-beta and delta-forming)
MTSILATLKQATWPHHERLEKKLELLNPGFSRPDYIRLLQAFWGYYRPMEIRLEAIPELVGWLPDFFQRTKLPLLETDLRILGIDGDTLTRLPVCRELPDCNNFASALGCLYVLEGSTLGGQVISRHLKRSLNLDAQNGASFFTGYGDATGAMWGEFRERLTNAKTDETAMVHAACETFITLEKWLDPINFLIGAAEWQTQA